LFEKAGIAEADIDEGFIPLATPKDVAGFIGKLGKLRVWGREPTVKMK
jgi:catalase